MRMTIRSDGTLLDFLDILTAWKAMVIKNVFIGLMLGNTAKTVSPTSPREVDETPDSLIGMVVPACFASIVQRLIVSTACYTFWRSMMRLQRSKTLSSVVINAQTFGAQYA